jgi:hypothetical protein
MLHKTHGPGRSRNTFDKISKELKLTERLERRRVIMKKKERAFGLVLITGIIFLLVQGQAWGFADVPNPYGVDPKASGTQYSGPLTVYLECVPILDKKGNVIEACDPDSIHLYFFVRLTDSKKIPYFYSYDAGIVAWEHDSLLKAFHDFIEMKLIPNICSTSPLPTFENGRVGLKSFTNNFVNTVIPPYYLIADIVIAVQQ